MFDITGIVFPQVFKKQTLILINVRCYEYVEQEACLLLNISQVSCDRQELLETASKGELLNCSFSRLTRQLLQGAPVHQLLAAQEK